MIVTFLLSVESTLSNGKGTKVTETSLIISRLISSIFELLDLPASNLRFLTSCVAFAPPFPLLLWFVLFVSEPNTGSELTTTVSVKFDVVNFSLFGNVFVIILDVVLESICEWFPESYFDDEDDESLSEWFFCDFDDWYLSRESFELFLLDDDTVLLTERLLLSFSLLLLFSFVDELLLLFDDELVLLVFFDDVFAFELFEEFVPAADDDIDVVVNDKVDDGWLDDCCFDEDDDDDDDWDDELLPIFLCFEFDDEDEDWAFCIGFDRFVGTVDVCNIIFGELEFIFVAEDTFDEPRFDDDGTISVSFSGDDDGSLELTLTGLYGGIVFTLPPFFYKIRKHILIIINLFSILKLINPYNIPIYCNGVDNNRNILHYPNNFQLLHTTNPMLGHKSHEIVAYILIYCTAYKHQPVLLNLFQHLDKYNTLNAWKKETKSLTIP